MLQDDLQYIIMYFLLCFMKVKLYVTVKTALNKRIEQKFKFSEKNREKVQKRTFASPGDIGLF